MPDPKYVLTNGANSSGTGATINGCKVKVLTPPPPATASEYELYIPGNSTYAQKLSGPLPVTFKNVSITRGTVTTTWDITVDTLPSASDAGTWVTPSQNALAAKDKDVPPTSGEFTAQSDGTFTEETAAYAGHGKK